MIRHEKTIEELLGIMESEDRPSFIQLLVCSDYLSKYKGPDKTIYVEKYNQLYQKTFG
ncbi:MAG: hypothetical protein Q7S33_00395 [Nanoarchaeota archaeon]|nr:hypothetical protein [Nanoarchaeota archaeon]